MGKAAPTGNAQSWISLSLIVADLEIPMGGIHRISDIHSIRYILLIFTEVPLSVRVTSLEVLSRVAKTHISRPSDKLAANGYQSDDTFR